MRRGSRKENPATSTVKSAINKVVDRFRVHPMQAEFARAFRARPKEVRNWFDAAQPAPGVVPDLGKKQKIAMDSQIEASIGWAANAISSIFEEGLTFLGYAFLAQLAQRAEYRRPVEIIATEMTRKFIEFKGTSDDDDKAERITELELAIQHFNLVDVCRIAAEHDGFYGRAHIYIEVGKDTCDDDDELKTPLVDSKGEISKAKLSMGELQYFKNVEPVWVYPTNYNTNNPARLDWYKPVSWFMLGKQTDASRLLTFIGREVPDLLKPAYSFGGLSLSQLLKPYVDNWLNTRQSVADIIKSFVTWVLATDMSAVTSPTDQSLYTRADLFATLKNNLGLMMVDKDKEEFTNVSAPLGTLDALQAQTQEHMAAVVGIPLVKLFGIQPMGLNASSDGEIKVFYDWIAAYQEKFFRKNLTILIHIVMMHLWGKIDEDIVWAFRPLEAMSEKDEAEVEKMRAETAQVHIESGVLSELEERKRIANSKTTQYPGLDVDDVPELPENEEGKLFNERKTVAAPDKTKEAA